MTGCSQLFCRRAQYSAAAAMLLIYLLSARDLPICGIDGNLLFTLPRAGMIALAAVLTPVACALFPAELCVKRSDRWVMIPLSALLGGILPASFILITASYFAPRTFILLFLICAGCGVGLFVLLRHAGGGKGSRIKKRCLMLTAALMTPVYACSLLALAIISAFSDMVAVTLLDRTTLDREELFDLYEDELAGLDHLSWLSCDEAERLSVLEVVAELECRWLGIEAPAIASAELDKDVLGQYDNKTRTIYISAEELRFESAFTCISTLLHELRHVYQFRVVESVNWDHSSSGLHYYREAEVWREELMSYVSGTHDSYEDYYEQEIEADARAYAKEHAAEYAEAFSRSNKS